MYLLGDALTWAPASACAAIAMGLIHMTVTLRRVETAEPSYEADFLVDPGATDSMAPARELHRIGLEPAGRMAYELADGSLREYAFGLARIEFMGEVTAGRVLFGPDDAEPLLGVTALESVGIKVDPTSRTLTRLPAISLKRPSRLAPELNPATPH
jgi:clan AA aspartic protease